LPFGEYSSNDATFSRKGLSQDYGLDSETLQSRALSLKCRCRCLRSNIAARRREAEEYEYESGVSLQRGATNHLLHLAAEVLAEGKQLILWLDR